MIVSQVVNRRASTVPKATESSEASRPLLGSTKDTSTSSNLKQDRKENDSRSSSHWGPSYYKDDLQKTPKPTLSSSFRSFDFLLEPQITKGRFSLPLQSECVAWLKYLSVFPLLALTSMLLVAFVWIPALKQKEGIEASFWSHVENPATFALIMLSVAVSIMKDLASEVAAGLMLLRGKRRRHLPDTVPRLVHAVIVCQYKEPLEVLDATIESLASNTLAHSTIVVLACEGRDPHADEIFQTLKATHGDSFRSFIKTTHHLQPGEVAGKSSNENYAAQELYAYVKDKGLDPYQVMVTTCDADSLFDAVFLEQLEGEFCRMPDGRRFIYNSPINTYRNLPECNFLVKFCELERCQGDVFNIFKESQAAQSNYSMTLGFCHEINYWDPSNTSEDYHTTLKAMAYTGNMKNVVVPVWSLILNDSVASFGDRWTQAKRHMWGIEEVPFVLSMFPVLRFTHWILIFAEVSKRMMGPLTPPELFFILLWDMFASLLPETKMLLLQIYLAQKVYDWIKILAREWFLHKYILHDRKHFLKGGWMHWSVLVLGAPFLIRVSNFVFLVLATWRMMFHAMRHNTLAYVVAPKAFNSPESSSSLESLKDDNDPRTALLPVEEV